MNTLEQIGENLKLARISKELTAEQLAEKTGYNHKTQNRYENSGKIPLDVLAVTCKALEVSMDDIVNKKAKIKIEFT